MRLKLFRFVILQLHLITAFRIVSQRVRSATPCHNFTRKSSTASCPGALSMLKATTSGQNCRLRLRYDCLAVRKAPQTNTDARDGVTAAYTISTMMHQDISNDMACLPGGPIKASTTTFYRRCFTDRRAVVMTDKALCEQRQADISHVTCLASVEQWKQDETREYYGLDLNIRYTNGVASVEMIKVRSNVLTYVLCSKYSPRRLIRLYTPANVSRSSKRPPPTKEDARYHPQRYELHDDETLM
jgi:hypothetical protein